MTAGALKNITTDALDKLAALLDEGHSDQLTALLKTMARFHKYSWHNAVSSRANARPRRAWRASRRGAPYHASASAAARVSFQPRRRLQAVVRRLSIYVEGPPTIFRSPTTRVLCMSAVSITTWKRSDLVVGPHLISVAQLANGRVESGAPIRIGEIRSKLACHAATRLRRDRAEYCRTS